LLELELAGKAIDGLGADRGVSRSALDARIIAFHRQRDVAVQALWQLRKRIQPGSPVRPLHLT
jgi:hypothetical protein